MKFLFILISFFIFSSSLFSESSFTLGSTIRAHLSSHGSKYYYFKTSTSKSLARHFSGLKSCTVYPPTTFDYVSGKTYQVTYDVCSNGNLYVYNVDATIVGSCPSGSSLINNVCTFPANSTIAIISHSSSGGVSEFEFSDGSYEICDTSSGTCSTMDKNGNTIPNLPIDGTTYDTIHDSIVHKFMNIGGIILSAIGATAVAIGTVGLGTPALIASVGTAGISGGFALSGTAFTSSNPYFIPTATNDNLKSTPRGIKIDLTKMNFDKPSSSFTHSISSNGNPISTKINKDGSIDTVENTPTDVVVSHKKSDNSEIKYFVPNSVFTTPNKSNNFSSANNPSSVKIKKISVSAPVIKNDGTKTFKDVVSTGVWGFGVKTVWSESKTFQNVSGHLNSSSSPTTTSATNSDGNNISTSSTKNDFSPITNRLDKLSNQQTKSNINTSKTNDLLKKIIENTDSNNTNTYTSKNIKTQNTIMKGFDTVKTSLNNVNKNYNSLLTVVNRGFSAKPINNGVTPTFETQIYGHTIKIELCSAFSHFYPIGYWFFTIVILIVSIKIFIYAIMLGV